MGAVVPTRSCAHSSGHGQRGAPAGASLGTWCPFPPHLPSAPHQRLGLQEPAWHQAGRMEDSRDGQRGGTLQPLRSHSHPRQPRRPQPQPRGSPPENPLTRWSSASVSHKILNPGGQGCSLSCPEL